MHRGMFVVLLLVVSACGSAPESPKATPSPPAPATARVELTAPPPYQPRRPARLTSRAVAAAALQHLETPDAAYDPRSRETSATLYYAPTPGRRSYTVAAVYGRVPTMFSCPGDESEAPRVSCEVSGRMRLVWREADARSGGMVGFLAPRARGNVLVLLEGVAVHGRPASADLPIPLRQLRALARDRRLDRRTDRELRRPGLTRAVWRSDPSCRHGAMWPPMPIGDGSTDTVPATPQGLAALLTTGIAGTGAGEQLSGGSGVAATVFLDGGDGEAVTARVTTDASAGTCPDGVDCEERDGALVAWALDVPPEYAMRVQVIREIDGGYLVLTERSHHADPTTRTFPVSVEALLELSNDPRFGLRLSGAVTSAGRSLPHCWRLTQPTADD